MNEISLSQYFDCGYQVVPGIVDDDTISKIQRFMKSAADAALDEVRDAIAFDTTDELIEKVAELQRTGGIEALDPEVIKLVSGHLPLRSRLDPILWTVPQSPRMRDLLAQLFPGQKTHMHVPPAARYVVPGNRHALVPAHQDVTYNKQMPDFVTIWVPFVPIDTSCGGVAVHLGTHKTEERVKSERKGFWFEPIAQADAEAVPCEVPLGGVLLLSNTIIHESMGNNSDRVRFSVDYRFFGDGVSTKHYLCLDTMELIAPEPALSVQQ